jgi:hypothetical protein
MSLDTVPAELTAWIISYLIELRPAAASWTQSYAPSKKGLSRYTGSSIALQHAIEYHLLSTLTLTSDDLATFDKLVSKSCSRRAAVLQRLAFAPILPDYDDIACAR